MEMRTHCERCETHLEHESVAFVCSYECTFCQPCTEEMKQTCPNCGGELVRRPKRVKQQANEQ